jgi:hypothetical protein
MGDKKFFYKILFEKREREETIQQKGVDKSLLLREGTELIRLKIVTAFVNKVINPPVS